MILQGEDLLAMGMKFLEEASAARSIVEKQANGANKEVRKVKHFSSGFGFILLPSCCEHNLSSGK